MPGSEPAVAPSATWGTVGTSETFPTPDAACRKQHEIYNPGATYQPPEFAAPHAYYCKWLAIQFGGPPGAGTVLPGMTGLGCPEPYRLTRTGTCILLTDTNPECDCTEDSQPVSLGANPIIGNPVSISTGAKIESETDFSTADGQFGVFRQYRSRQHSPSRHSVSSLPGFGPNWHGILPGRLTVFESNHDRFDRIEYLTPSGGVDYFKVWNFWDAASWAYVAEANGRRQLEMVAPLPASRKAYLEAGAAIPNGPAEFKLTESDGSYTLYRRADAWSVDVRERSLIPIQQVLPGGYTRYFDYDDVGEFPTKIRDSFGREMTLTWTEAKAKSVYTFPLAGGGTGSNFVIYGNMPRVSKVITEVALPGGEKLIYTYGDTSSTARVGRDDRLMRVSRRDSAHVEIWAREYLYENSDQPYALTGIKDQNGQRLSTYEYHAYGLVKSSERVGGVGRVEIDYTEQPDQHRYRLVTNPLGREEVFRFDRIDGLVSRAIPSVLGKREGLATATVEADVETHEHRLYITTREDVSIIRNKSIDPRGTVTEFANDYQTRRPNEIIEAPWTSVGRTTNFQWHATLDLPTRIDVPGLRTEMTYGATGELLTRTLTDTTTHSLPYATTGQTRTETYSWGAGGRLTAINGPRVAVGAQDDISSFAYDSVGNLLTVTNGLNHVTTFAGHDANGRPASVTDVNGIQTLFTYDALGRLLTSTVRHPTTAALDATTTYEYDIEGRVTGIIAPATEKLSFVYDLAGRLLEIAAPDGEKQSFAHDAMGNVTEQKIKRADGAVRSTIARTFDSIGRMLTETLGPGRTTAWQYDKNGNPVRTTSPRSHATDMAFDPLNRLTSTVAPDTGTTAMLYNAKDEPTRFTDAVNVQTNFVRNGFGEIIQETSPDRGTSIYYYDAAGDLTAAIDGRGQRIDYTRDILGRVTSKTPVGRPASETVTFAYDSGGAANCHCVGRLASMTDASGTTSFGYDHRGNLTDRVQPVGAMTWTHDLADRIIQVRYPSGRDVAYSRDAKGRVIEVKTRTTSGSAWTVLATNIAYEPFGPMLSADFGNGLKLAQDWGSDRRLASKRLTTAAGADVWHLSYGYDGDDNIISITDHVTPANGRSFGYDSVDRLNRVDGGTSGFAREDYVHDKNGNLLRVERRVNADDASPAQSDVHAIASGTNRLTSVVHAAGTRSFAHDARGNLTADTRPAGAGVTLAYDGHARLASYARADAETQAMLYNGFDERVGLTTTLGGSTAEERRFAYDAGHRIVGEYGATTSDLRAEYIWLLPEVGDGSAFGGDDGLGGYMPLAVAVPDGGTSKLRWVQGNHLGTPVVTTDASGAIVTPSGYAHIGFPGQVEQHADLYYNYHRDYDPTLGRYVQADPIGLDGDVNPFVYAEANPLSIIDPEGLQGKGKISPRSVAPRCHPLTQLRLQVSVNKACKWNDIRTCNAMMTCQQLQEQVSKRMQCVTARERINSVCFAGGDFGHRKAIKDTFDGVLKCQSIMMSKSCGCPIWR